MSSKKVEFWGRRMDCRSLGLQAYIGANNHVVQDLYRALMPSENHDLLHSGHGGIFNLSFAPEGSILVAATEGKSILIFDPLNHKLIREVTHAHTDCVNYARFLDSRTFATCSDDTTVALWDVRNLGRKIRSLVGHSNWVKNIEYASAEGLLVTSGFDGSIHTWDINKFSENGTEFQRIFYTNGLMRMRLTPDNRKMVICTTGGYLVVIHDLDLHTLAHDLRGFKLPKMYRWRASERAAYHAGDCSGHHFTARRNRVELICDFPSENDAEIISSLQVHPHGWCVLSRNTSRHEKSEVRALLSLPPCCDMLAVEQCIARPSHTSCIHSADVLISDAVHAVSLKDEWTGALDFSKTILLSLTDRVVPERNCQSGGTTGGSFFASADFYTPKEKSFEQWGCRISLAITLLRHCCGEQLEDDM